MPENENRGPHLRTKHVFIDTQAFRKARFDWNGWSLSKLAEFAKQGQLRLLVTDVTVREVKSQLHELLTEANSSLTKHSGILEQLGASVAIDRLRDQVTALSTLEGAFDEFLKRTNAVNVPLISDIKGVLDDYFARRPPFSTKKKAEFPDAVTIASVRLWCQQNRSTAYIVSEDLDLRECCSEAGPLFHVESIAEIISHATVSQELHDALEKALRASEYLSERLAEEIKELDVEISRASFHGRGVIAAAKIDNVHSVNVTWVNVLDQREQTFTCEPEIEAEISLDIDVENEEDYRERPSKRLSISQSRIEYFYPEVIVRFEPSTEDLEFVSISLGTRTIRVGIDDVVEHLRR